MEAVLPEFDGTYVKSIYIKSIYVSTGLLSAIPFNG